MAGYLRNFHCNLGKCYMNYELRYYVVNNNVFNLGIYNTNIFSENIGYQLLICPQFQNAFFIFLETTATNTFLKIKITLKRKSVLMPLIFKSVSA